MYVQIARFKSAMTYEQLLEKSKARLDRYRATDGLLQKYYLKYPDTDEYGAVYIWESERAMKDFRRSGLSNSIADAFKVQGTPEMIPAEVIMTLYPDVSASRKAVTIGRK